MASPRSRNRPTQNLAPAALWRRFDDQRLKQLERVQRAFEIARAQFAEDDLSAPEWQQTADALDHAYDACAGQEDLSIVAELCNQVTRYIAIAVEKSSLQSARLSASYNS